MRFSCWERDHPNPFPMSKFLDTCANTPQLVGEVLVIDLTQIHVLLMNFISGNKKYETKWQAIIILNDGRHDL